MSTELEPPAPAALREALHYDPVGGGLYWVLRPGLRTRARAGDRIGCVRPDGYRSGALRGVQFLEHRAVWAWHTGVWPSLVIDHINGQKTDNRIENLRDVTGAVNTQNVRLVRPHNRSTGVLGVNLPADRKRYRASIHHNGRSVYLGYHDTAEQAHAAYIEAKRRLHEGNTL